MKDQEKILEIKNLTITDYNGLKLSFESITVFYPQDEKLYSEIIKLSTEITKTFNKN